MTWCQQQTPRQISNKVGICKQTLPGLCLILLTACGGGSNESDNDTGTDNGGQVPQPQPNFTVSATAAAGGSVSPVNTVVSKGETARLSITPHSGYSIANVSGCGGALDGNQFTTGAIEADCAVNAGFSRISYTVTTTSTENGSVNPDSVAVFYGETASLTITPDNGYNIDAVSGCGGTLQGNVYTTAAVTADCAVNAGFIRSFSVSTNTDNRGLMSPVSARVSQGQTATFTITANNGYSIADVSGCGGVLNGTEFTTTAITADCTINSTFTVLSAQNVKASALHRQAAIAWDAIVGATDYCLYGSKTPGISLADPASYDADLSVCMNADVNKYTIAGLTNTNDYYFALSTKVGNDESALSNEMRARPGKKINDSGNAATCTTIQLFSDPSDEFLDCSEAGATATQDGQDVDGNLVPKGQDALFGRDADVNLVKAGGGHDSMDFTRICNNGAAEGEGDCPLNMTAANIGDGPNQWACNYDNVTGLMWEVKSLESTHLRSNKHTYSFFKEVIYGPGNTGSFGTENGGVCFDEVNCDTDKFVAQVNGSGGICGYGDWRMPLKAELRSIMLLDESFPSIDADYFPDLEPVIVQADKKRHWFWSASVSPRGDVNRELAFVMFFLNGGEDTAYIKHDSFTLTPYKARLVRSNTPSVFSAPPPPEHADEEYAANDMSMQWVEDDIQAVLLDTGYFSADMIVTRPVRMYTDHGDGTVTDKATGLMWKKCSEGQVYQPEEFYQSQCGFLSDSLLLNWVAALNRAKAVNDGVAGESLGYNDWRLPSIKELDALMMTSMANPGMNAVLFPGKHQSDPGINDYMNLLFWSSTPAYSWNWSNNAYSKRAAWAISLITSQIMAPDTQVGEFYVLLVRDPG